MKLQIKVDHSKILSMHNSIRSSRHRLELIKLSSPMLEITVKNGYMYTEVPYPFHAKNSFSLLLILLGVRGWLHLTRDRDWLYDPSVIVTPRHPRWVLSRRVELKLMFRSNLGSDPCPPEANVIYPDQDLESLNSSSLNTCVDTCIQNIVCVGVTLEGDTCTLKHSTRSRSYLTSLIRHHPMLFWCFSIERLYKI